MTFNYARGQEACIAQVNDRYVVKDSYNAKAIPGQKNTLSFSYEIEYNLKENPKLLKYYKITGMDDKAWKALSPEKQLKLATDKHNKTVDQDDVVLEKLDDAPEFLPKRMIKETDENLEMVDNPITTNLNEVNKNLDWIWANIGPGSVQGHVAFDLDGALLKNIEKTVKIDYDISQAQSLSKGYASYIKTGKGNPGANLTHHSLGPVNDVTLKTITSNTTQGKTKAFLTRSRREKLKSTTKIDNNLKLNYGIAYRPDLYGKSKVGFEIRNCHKRLDCIKKKMQELSSELEDGLALKAKIPKSPEISADMLKNLPPSIREVYLNAAEAIRLKNPAQMPGTQYKERFLFPHLDWAKHPLIQVLPEAKKEIFLRILKESTEEYVNTVKKMPRTQLANNVRDLEISTAKWAHDIDLDVSLSAGLKILKKAEKRDFVEDLGLNLPRQNLAESALYDKVNDFFSTNFFHGITDQKSLHKIRYALNGMSEKDLPRTLKLLEVPEGAESLRNFLKISEKELIQDLLHHSESTSTIKFMNNVSKLSPSNQKKLTNILKNTGIKTDITTPDGSWAKKKVLENSPKSLNNILDAMNELKLSNNEAATFFKQRNLTWLPGEVESAKSLKKVVSIFSGRKSSKNLLWVKNRLENLKFGTSKGKVKLADEKNFNQMLFLESHDGLKMLSGKAVLINLNNKKFVVKFSKSKKHPYQYIESTVYGEKNITKELKNRAKILQKSKIKVTELELRTLIRSKKNSVFVISATDIHHQGMVIDDMVYSVVHSGGITKLPVENWISRWGQSTLVELNVDKAQRLSIYNSLERELGVPVKFAISAKPGHMNCTNMVSCHLEESKVMNFPNDVVRGDSQHQLRHLVNNIGKDKRIKAVYVRGENNIVLTTIIATGSILTISPWVLSFVFGDDD